jgi:hypothetical protein
VYFIPSTHKSNDATPDRHQGSILKTFVAEQGADRPQSWHRIGSGGSGRTETTTPEGVAAVRISGGTWAGRLVIDIVKSFFVPLVCLGMLLSGLLHLFLPGETGKHMSCRRNVRIVGAVLLALILPATVWGFYVLAALFVIFGLPRLFAPARSIRLQQRSYPRRVHGVLLVMGAVGLWIVSRLVHR